VLKVIAGTFWNEPLSKIVPRIPFRMLVAMETEEKG
jgi:hypothetical protein